MSPAAPRRRIAIALAATFALATTLPALAQSIERPRPPGTVPLEDVPPPPPMIATQPEPEPQVSSREENGETVQEYRINNKLYMMRVTPKGGHPYILMDLKGDGTFTRQDAPVDGRLRVPQWVLMEF
jgi:hypothetical protein